MKRIRALVLALFSIPAIGVGLCAAEEADPVAPWRENVTVRPLTDAPGRHTIHSYYVCNPESPDGKRVVFYTSTAVNGHKGNVCMLDRETGKETVLARDVNTEDAHRAACQQWICGGQKVAFHDVRDGRWLVALVDATTGAERILAPDHQLAFGQGAGEWLPIYGCHWNPGDYRDLELVNASTLERRTAVKAEQIEQAYPDWIKKEFGEKRISIFFPVLSPDFTRVFFKIAAGNGGTNYMSSGASHRQGLVGYDLAQNRLTFMRTKWGHPAWHPDSRQIIEMGNLLINSDGGAITRIPNQPYLRGCHPSVSPDGKLFVSDGTLESLGGKPGEWGILVGDIRGERHQIIHRFDNTHGAKSWRVNHPHPVFSADGRRIYFNVNSGDWTQLYVAEVAAK
jgi:Tol biopolymer transport system component